jgi:hypothetical protein
MRVRSARPAVVTHLARLARPAVVARLAVIAGLAVLTLAPAPAAAEPGATVEPSKPSDIMARSNCSPAAIATAEHCLRQVATALVPAHKCSNFAAFSKCWPECFCEHSEGYTKIARPFQEECPHLPACGSAA